MRSAATSPINSRAAGLGKGGGYKSGTTGEGTGSSAASVSDPSTGVFTSMGVRTASVFTGAASTLTSVPGSKGALELLSFSPGASAP